MLRNDIIHTYMGELVFSTCIQYLRAEPGQVVTEGSLKVFDMWVWVPKISSFF